MILLFFFFGKRTEAQPVTIDTEPAKVSYYRMPDNPLDPSFTTYTSDISIPFSELGKTGMTKSNLVETYLKLEGYKRVTQKGDVEITATVGDFTIWMENRATTRTKTKDKDGNEQVRYKYHMEVKYSLPLTLQVYDREGHSLMDTYIMSNTNTQTWSSPTYSSLSDLESYWRVQRASRLTQLHKELMQQGLKNASDKLNLTYGYRRISDTVRFETIGKKKHEQYDIFQNNLTTLVEAFKLMDADKGLEEIKSKIKPALAFYNAQAGKFKSSSKDDERLRHICLYNQALALFWVEDFDQAETFVKEIQRRDPKDRDAKRLLEEIEETRASLSRAGRTTRHKVVVGSRT